MAVVRVEKNSNYTVMANYHLRDKGLTLKAKGLLSVMLSLPPEWDFTVAGLTLISKEGISAIRAAISELEKAGYVIRSRVRNASGQIVDVEYTIYEFPQNDPACRQLESGHPLSEKPMLENLTLDNPTLDYLTLENPILEKPTLENRTQLNTEGENTYPKKKDKLITDPSNRDPSSIHPSNPEASPVRLPMDPDCKQDTDGFAPLRSDQQDGLTERQRIMSASTSIPGLRRKLSINELVRKIRMQIEYEDLIDEKGKEEIDNIVSIMVEVMSAKCEYFTISGKQYPADLVHKRFSQIDFHTVEYVTDCLHRCGSDIRNIKQYLIAALFNAPATYDSYYSAAVRRDFEYLRK